MNDNKFKKCKEFWLENTLNQTNCEIDMKKRDSEILEYSLAFIGIIPVVFLAMVTVLFNSENGIKIFLESLLVIYIGMIVSLLFNLCMNLRKTNRQKTLEYKKLLLKYDLTDSEAQAFKVSMNFNRMK